MQPDREIELGIVGVAHGLRGEVTLHLHNPGSNLPFPGMKARLQMPSGAARTAKVLSVRGAAKGRIVAFAGVPDRTAAEALKGARLIVRRGDLPPPGEGEFYYEDLPGLPVRLPDGTGVGTVTSVFRGATDILVLDVVGREVLVPCVADFVRAVGTDAVVIEAVALEEPA